MNNYIISPWIRYCTLVAVSTMFAGYPLVAAIAQLTGLPSTPLSIAMRSLTAAACIGIMLMVPLARRASLPILLLFPLLIFWILFLIRITVDTYYSGYLLYYEPYTYWVWSIGGSLIPMLALSRIVHSDELVQDLFRWTFYMSLLAVLLIIPSIGTSLQSEEGILQDTGRGRIEALNPISLGHLGVQLVLMSLWQLFLRPDKVGLRRNWLFFIATIVGTYVALVANSRGPLVAFLFVALFTLAASRLRSRFMLLGILFLGTVGFVPMVNLIDAISGTAIYARLFEQSQFEEVSTVGRLDLYSSAWNLFLNKPLFGAGLEDPTFGGYPHNVFIEAFMATGFAGGTAFFIGVVAVVYAAFLIIRELPLYTWISLIALQQLLSAQFSGTLIQSTTMWGAIALIISVTGLRMGQENGQRARKIGTSIMLQGR
jgi:O-antigen ligase